MGLTTSENSDMSTTESGVTTFASTSESDPTAPPELTTLESTDMLTTETLVTSSIVAATTSEPPVGFEYYLSETGHCVQKKDFITTLEQCEDGAIYLGLADTSVQSIRNEDRPYGCFYKSSASSNQLWLNKDDEAGKKLDDADR